MSSAYLPQTYGQTEAVNKNIQMCLRYFCGECLKEWCRWLLWVEFCYNTLLHSSCRMTPYRVLYGKDPPTLLTYVPETWEV